MKKYAFFMLLLLAAPLSAQAEQVEFDLTFTDSNDSSTLVVADAFKTIRRSNVSLSAIRDLQDEVRTLRRTVDELQRRLGELERRPD